MHAGKHEHACTLKTCEAAHMQLFFFFLRAQRTLQEPDQDHKEGQQEANYYFSDFSAAAAAADTGQSSIRPAPRPATLWHPACQHVCTAPNAHGGSVPHLMAGEQQQQQPLWARPAGQLSPNEWPPSHTHTHTRTQDCLTKVSG